MEAAITSKIKKIILYLDIKVTGSMDKHQEHEEYISQMMTS